MIWIQIMKESRHSHLNFWSMNLKPIKFESISSCQIQEGKRNYTDYHIRKAFTSTNCWNFFVWQVSYYILFVASNEMLCLWWIRLRRTRLKTNIFFFFSTQNCFYTIWIESWQYHLFLWILCNIYYQRMLSEQSIIVTFLSI